MWSTEGSQPERRRLPALASLTRLSPPALPWRLGASLLSVAAATLLRVALEPQLGTHAPYIPFFMAIVFSAWYGGLGPGLLSLVASAVAVDLLFIPRNAFAFPQDPVDLLSLGLFLATGAGIVAVGDLQRRSQLRAEEHALRAEDEAGRRRMAEDDLRQRVAEMQTLMDTLPLAVFLAHDPECSRVTANHVGSRLLQVRPGAPLPYAADEARPAAAAGARREAEGIHPEELPLRYAAVHGVEVHGYELEHTYADGTVVTLLGHASPLMHADGSVRGAVGAFLDITDRKQAEMELQRRQAEIELLNERLQQAMRETHHRVKNNLQLVAAMVDMQAMDGGDSVPMDEMHRLSAHIRALSAVHDVLTQNAATGDDAQSLAVGPVLEGVLAMTGGQGLGRVRCCLDELVLSTRQGTSLALIACELAGNAAKHGGPEIAVTLRVDGGTARLAVEDNGPGFPPGFDPARSAHTGLDLVDNLGRWDLAGSIGYENRPEGGARVTISFPVQSAA